MIKLKRIYDPPAKDDGCRVLVDRLWPRGLSKEDARAERWLKDVAPSDELRKWFAHDPARFEEFKARYRQELGYKTADLDEIKRLEKRHKTVTLLYAAKDQARNNAVVLADMLRDRKPPSS